MPRPDPRKSCPIDLALQGGGSHGAFTWGVLDRLLEEDWLKLEAISGTSAGAMNAVVLADGYEHDGPAGARKALETFWRKVSDAARFSPFQRTPLDILLGRWTLDSSPAYLMMDMMARLVSPYQMNPAGKNPLTEILEECVDFGRLVASPVRVFITATNVESGRGRVFRNAELSPQVLLASACLPTVYQAVEIDGVPYWDGGFSGNPTLTPLIEDCAAEDTILVQINPIERPGTPRTAREIQSRINEVSFNAVLLKELRMAAIMRKVADAGHAEGSRWGSMRLHRIASDIMLDLGSSSKMNAEWAFLTMLRDKGREAADAFLQEHGNDIGQRPSFDLDELIRDH